MTLVKIVVTKSAIIDVPDLEGEDAVERVHELYAKGDIAYDKWEEGTSEAYALPDEDTLDAFVEEQ